MAGEMLPPVVAQLLLDLVPFSEGAARAKAEGRELAGSLDASLGSMDGLAGSADAAGASLERTGTAAGAARGDLAAMAASGDAAAGSLDRVTAASTEAAGSQAKVAESAGLMGAGAAKGAREVKAAEQDAETHSGGFSSRVSSMFKGLGNTMGSFGIPFAGSVSKMGEDVAKAETQGHGFTAALTNVGKVATFVGGTALVGVGVESIKAAENFSRSMELIRTQAGGTQNEVENLKGSVLSLAGEVATSPDELSAGLFHLESQGLRGAKAMETLKYAAEGAKVGQANLEDVTNALGGVIASKIGGVHSYSEAMGDLNATVGAGDMRMQDLASAMGTGIATSAAVAGLKLKDVSAALAVFGDNNMRGSKAAIYLRQAIMSMMAPSKAATTALEQLGIKQGELAGDMRSGGLLKTVEDLKSHLQSSGMTAVQTGEIIAHALGGVKSATGMEILINQLGRLKEKYKDVEGGAHGFAGAWQMTTQQAKVGMEKLTASIDALAIRFGEVLIPVTEHVASVFAEVVNWFAKGSPVALALAAAIGGPLVAAMIVWATTATAAGIANVAAWVATQAAAVASGAETAAIAALYVADWLGMAAGAVASAAVQVGAWVAVGAAATAAFIAENVATLGIAAGIALLVAGAVFLATHWSEVWGTIKSVVGAAVNFIKAHLPLILLALAPLTGGLSLVALAAIELYQHWQSVWGAIESVTDTVVDAIKNAIAAAWGAVESVFETVWNAIRAYYEAVWGIYRTIVTTAVAVIRSVIETAWNTIRSVTQTVWNAIRSVIETVLSQIVSLVSSGLAAVVHFFTGLPGRIVGALGSLAHKLFEVGQHAIEGLLHGIEAVAGKVTGFISKLAGDVVSLPAKLLGIKSPSKVFESYGWAIGEGLAKGINNSAHLVQSAMSNVVTMVNAAMSKVLTGSAVNAATNPGYGVGGGGSVEQDILKTAMAHGLSANAAAGMVGNAAQESSLSPSAGGGGLYQMSGYPSADSAGSAMQQTIEAIKLMGPAVVRAMNKAHSAAEAAVIMETMWEKPAGSQPGETATTNNRPHREQAAEEAVRHIKGAVETAVPVSAAGALKGTVEHTTPVVGEMSLKRAIEITDAHKAKRGVQTTIESAEAKKAAEVVKHAIETAKLNVAELKKVLSSAFSEFAKDAEKLFKMTLAKGGAKAKELEGLEASHGEDERAKAVTAAEAGLVTARTEATELEANARTKLADAEAKLAIAKRRNAHSAETISAEETLASARHEAEAAPAAARAKLLAAEEALNNARYAVKVAALKKEAAAEEAAIAHENSAKEAAFHSALHQLEQHLAHGRTSTNRAMHDIEGLLRHYGVTFGVVGKDAGEAWVKQFEKAIRKAALDSGALSAEIRHDLAIGLKIPGLAQGGIVTSPTLAVVGEAGPEAVIPLSGLSIDQPSPLPLSGAAGTRQVTNNFNVTNYSPERVLPQNLVELSLLLRPMLQGI